MIKFLIENKWILFPVGLFIAAAWIVFMTLCAGTKVQHFAETEIEGKEIE